MSDSTELASRAIDRLDLSPEVKGVLKEIQAEVAEAYRDSFVAMVQAINRQASAIDRIQASLDLLIRHTRPSLAEQLPPVIKVADSADGADLATALVVADPIGAGFTLSVTAVSNAIGLSVTDVSILLKAFKIADDEKYAVVVRRGGKHNTIVNYNPATIDRLRHLIANPPAGLTRDQKSTVARVTKRLVMKGEPASSLPPGKNDG